MNYSRRGRIQSGKRETGKDGKLLDSTNSRDLSGSYVVPQRKRTSGACFCITESRGRSVLCGRVWSIEKITVKGVSHPAQCSNSWRPRSN